MVDDRIAPRLEQLGDHVKSLGAPWRAELRGNGSFRLLYAEGKVSYWPSARRPMRAFLDMGQTADVGAVLAFASLPPVYKNKRGIPLEVTDFDVFEEWAFSEAPERDAGYVQPRPLASPSKPGHQGLGIRRSQAHSGLGREDRTLGHIPRNPLLRKAA